MNLFLDNINKPSNFILFDNNKKIINISKSNILWNKSALLILKIDKFLKKNKLNYFDLKNIILINWPGSFTWIRTNALIINTINYIINKNITTFNFFELYEISYKNPYPIIKISSQRDVFIQKWKNKNIEIIKNEELKIYLKINNLDIIYGDLKLDKIKTINKIDYRKIIKNMEFQKHKLIKPLYIKKPNIN